MTAEERAGERVGSIGYLIPSVLPDSYKCIKVYYPDAEEFRWALSGSLQGLGTWVVWEKDGTNRAALAARLWKTANEMTFAEMDAGQGCEDMTDLTEVVEKLQMIADRVGNLCNCLAPSAVASPPVLNPCQIGVPIEPPAGFPVTPIPPSTTPPPDDPDWEEYVCGAANYMIDWLTQELMGNYVSNMLQAFPGDIDAWQAFIGDILGVFHEYFAEAWDYFWDLLVQLMNIGQDTLLRDAIEYIESRRDCMICEIADSGSAEEARERAMTCLYGGSGGVLAKAIARKFWQSVNINLAFQLNAVTLPVEYQGLECDCLPDGVCLVPMTLTVFSGNASVDEFGWVRPGPGSGTTVDLNIDGGNDPSWLGYVVELRGLSGSFGLFCSSALRVHECIVPQSSYGGRYAIRASKVGATLPAAAEGWITHIDNMRETGSRFQVTWGGGSSFAARFMAIVACPE